jgi:hypothetical protein
MYGLKQSMIMEEGEDKKRMSRRVMAIIPDTMAAMMEMRRIAAVAVVLSCDVTEGGATAGGKEFSETFQNSGQALTRVRC